MGVLLGLAVAIAYGTGDFFGGLSAKRNQALVVVALSQSCGLVVMAAAALVAGGHPGGGDLLAGAAAGSVGLTGVVLLYRGLAGGNMGVIAPITAVGAAVLPLLWGLATGERPSPAALVGVVVALVAVVLISGGGAVSGGREIALALAAGAAFGTVFVLLGTTGPDAGLWPVLMARVLSVPLAIIVATAGGLRLRPAPGTGTTVVVAGVLDATANALFLVATRNGLLSLVSVLSSLYPAATVVLAWSVLHERVSRRQGVGLGLALAGVALIAAG